MGNIHLEFANNKKDYWTNRLRAALNNKDLIEIEEILNEMEKYKFTE